MALYRKKAEKLQDSINESILKRMPDSEAFSFAGFDEQEVERSGYSNYSYWRSTLHMFLKNKVAVFLTLIVFLILLFTFIQPYLPNQIDPFLVNNDPKTGLPFRNVKPNDVFWLGTNSIGQDLWANLWSGTRTSLFIGISVACIEAFVGIVVGVLWGYVRKLDFLLTELYNVMDNIPTTIVLILVSYILKPGIYTIILALCLQGWIGMALFIRNQIIIIRDREYNLASRCLGTRTYKIIQKNLIPYLISVIMLRMALTIPAAIGSEVFITYIGLGLPATIPSLGNLINVGRQLMMSPDLRYQLIYPTIILSIVTVSFYVIGNAFSDAADPKNHI
ncbi:MAG: Dipeptide transport system permease protein DppC [Firmicutes bacterium ADurb.Bin182]|nr:MAG: Dipeptide transport system permease protein DppC [Firmicutes bacterium ADurb.Bin182]